MMHFRRILLLILFFSLLAACGGEPDPAESNWELVASQGLMHMVWIKTPDDEDAYRLAVSEACGTSPICQVLFWDRRGMTPISLPMNESQSISKIAHYQRNQNTGLNQWHWPCSVNQVPDCIK